MQVRKLSVRIGAVVRAIDADSYSLPKRLPSGAEVTVMSYDLKTITAFAMRPGENGPSRRSIFMKALEIK